MIKISSKGRHFCFGDQTPATFFFQNATISSQHYPFQYLIRRFIVRSRKASKPRDLYLESSDRSEIWQAPRQQCCRSANQISKRCDNLNHRSRGFEILRDLTIRRLIGYWNGALECFIEVLWTINQYWIRYNGLVPWGTLRVSKP